MELFPRFDNSATVTESAPRKVAGDFAHLQGRGTSSNRRDANEVIAERPWHRHAAYYLAAGFSIKETATACEASSETISGLLRAPWFQARVTEIMKESLGNDVMSLFKSAALDAFVTLHDLMLDKDTSPMVKKACATEILDRGFGKSVQRMEVKGQVMSDDPVAEAKRLREAIAKEQEALGAG